MDPLIKITGKDADIQLGEFVSTNFKEIKYDKNGCDVIVEPPFKPAQITVRMNDGVDLSYAEQCAKHFNNLSPETTCKLLESSWQYCLKFCDYYGEELPEIKEFNELLYYIEPFCIYIDKPKSNDTAYTVELHCDWEVEHGMSWIIRNSEILYVGVGMVHFQLNAWEDFDAYKNNEGNFVFGVPNWE
ncbi:DUF6985 domain-containing protein [Paenibacillus sp.]|uniref:DUF6985 domain-containing protein n=1 Tax=Paenibacillus sp. TaxID=58172 RepID=UPI00282F84E2|nr:hypothetical protein [Paenibacillus sp.]MDR0268835.1 hypothetical protein [Paenibacillus sp.]